MCNHAGIEKKVLYRATKGTSRTVHEIRLSQQAETHFDLMGYAKHFKLYPETQKGPLEDNTWELHSQTCVLKLSLLYQ